MNQTLEGLGLLDSTNPQAPGEQASGEQASGEQASGERSSGEQASGEQKKPRVFVDCTTGRGGHALAIAQRLFPGDRLICLDADPKNLTFAKERIAAASVGCAVDFVHSNFTQLPMVLGKLGIEAVDGILADLGLSTNQLLSSETGLSFNAGGPLDMRIDPRTKLTAGEIVNTWPEKEIADLVFNLADERYSRRIARKIIESRRIAPILDSRRLAEVIRSAVPGVKKSRAGKGQSGGSRRPGRSTESIDPATRTFLALRMKVNRESENLRDLLTQAPDCLRPGGRLAVISFQSTEDRIVKHTFIELAKDLALQGEGYGFGHGVAAPVFRIITKKPVGPTDDEVLANPRSRSAKLRVVERLAT